ncbi:MAG TPA: S1C family serine protease [Fimbriimonadaceae bacterium]|nr:S1C family serine protease [Fimbriimonadaceae bacterium]
MLLSVVNWAWFLTALSQTQSVEAMPIWKQIEPSVVTLLNADQKVGAAALIDDAGLFLAHRSQLPLSELTARFSDGRSFRVRLVTTDDPTQLSLLQASEWQAGKYRIVATVNTSPSLGNQPMRANIQRVEAPVLAVLPDGRPMRAELVGSGKIGIVNPARRVMTLSEYRFESPPQSVGGALLFSMDGRLLGVLGATLEPEAYSSQRAIPQGFGGGGGLNMSKSTQNFGPGALTVGFSIGPEILERVVEGFRSPSREVEHPALGILCKDSLNPQGALIESVLPKSPAEQANLTAGDVIVELDGFAINTQIDYAKAMLRQRVGNKVRLKVSRNGAPLTIWVTVGK